VAQRGRAPGVQQRCHPGSSHAEG